MAQIHESSPLDLASEEPERLPCLQRLLDLGADVNAADKNGKYLKDGMATAGLEEEGTSLSPAAGESMVTVTMLPQKGVYPESVWMQTGPDLAGLLVLISVWMKSQKLFPRP